MADVQPFKGLRYNQDTVGDVGSVICPPFDTISADMQSSLYEQSPYNVVRLESGQSFSTDTPQNNRYTRSALLLARWIQDQVLVQEERSSFYLVRHTFHVRGEQKTRLELMGRVKLEEYESRVVLPHEYTRDADKRDRLALMEACRANLSPIMCLYQDSNNAVSEVLQKAMSDQPTLDFSDSGGNRYAVWPIEAPDPVNSLREELAGKQLYIADGHHRYETALNHRNLMRSKVGERHTREEGFDFVMMGLVDFSDPGLVVLPYHRVVGGLSATSLAEVRYELWKYFDGVPVAGDEQAGLDVFLDEVDGRGRDHLALGLMDPETGSNQVLVLKGGIDLSSHGPIAGSEAWVLEELILKPTLGGSLGQRIDYIHDAEGAKGRVKVGEFQLGFFLKPFPLKLFETVMDLGQRLPPKSTFFYPKLATGLVMNLLEADLQSYLS